MMRFKIDENIHPAAAGLLRQHRHDAVTVIEQKLRGKPDEKIASVCKKENRILITLDLDFSNIRSYPPAEFAGFIVLRLEKQGRDSVLHVLKTLLPFLEEQLVGGQLWVVDEKSIRVRERT